MKQQTFPAAAAVMIFRLIPFMYFAWTFAYLMDPM